MTTVINIKDAPRGWMDDPQYVYIGRERAGAISRYKPLAEQTVATGEWGNPYVLSFEKHRQQILELYKTWLYNQDKEFLHRMDTELRGKILVCFCKPKACHGDVIVEYLNRDDYLWKT